MSNWKKSGVDGMPPRQQKEHMESISFPSSIFSSLSRVVDRRDSNVTLVELEQT